MHPVSLYVTNPLACIESTQAKSDLSPNCRGCALNESAQTVGIGAEGAALGVLFVGEGPGKDEDSYRAGDIKGRPFVGRSGQFLRRLIATHMHDRNFALDNATRCYPGSTEVKTDHVDACRPYLADTIRNAQPERIVALGAWAMYSLLGRTFSPLSVRRGYDWLWNNGAPIPVFLLMHPAAAVRNRFLEQQFEEDFKWAIDARPRLPPWAEGALEGRAGATGRNTAFVVTTPEEAERACAYLLQADWFAWDVETVGVQFESDFEIVSVSCTGLGLHQTWEWDGPALTDPKTLAPLLRLLENPKALKVEQNGKYDRVSAMLAWNIRPKGLHGDTRLWRRLLEPEADADLDTMGNLVGMGGHKGEAKLHLEKAVESLRVAAKDRATMDMFGTSDTQRFAEGMVRLGAKPESYAYGLLPLDVRRRYNARDSVATARVGAKLEYDLSKVPELQRIWNLVVRRVAEAIPYVEFWGVPISRDKLITLTAELTMKSELLEKQLQAKYPGFNPYSTLQVRKLLYETLGIPITHRTDKGNPSVDEAALDALKTEHPIVSDIIECRRLQKLKGTYSEGLQNHVRADDRIHGSINMDGARSGRASMSDPNLQNVPGAKSSLEAKAIRDCFVAPPGFVLIECDYSQIELRVAAWLSNDRVMIDLFNSGKDFHLATSQLIAPIAWGIQPSEVNEEHRRGAKTVNFGLAYGLSDQNLAARLGCTVELAGTIRAAVFGQFRRFQAWTKECQAEAHHTGLTWTYWAGQRARRRPLWRIGDRGQDKFAKEQRSHAERVSYNNPVQGTAAEFCMMSLARNVEAINAGEYPPDTQLVLPIHDSLMFVARKEHAKTVAQKARGIMLDYDTGDVPLDVDVKYGESWGSMEKMKV